MNMRRSKRGFWFAAFWALLLLFGCRSRIEVDGESYAMLDDREIAELKFVARETLLHNSSRLLDPQDIPAVRSKEPELAIDYRGDCSGQAVVTWDLAKRKYEVVIEGELNERSPRKRDIMVRVMGKYPEVLDLRSRRPGAAAPRRSRP